MQDGAGLTLLAERIGLYYPRYLGSLALYVGLAALLYSAARACSFAPRRVAGQ